MQIFGDTEARDVVVTVEQDADWNKGEFSGTALAGGKLRLTQVVPAPKSVTFSERTDPVGFTVSAPTDWTVTGDARTGRATLVGSANEQMLIQPMFVPQALTAEGAQATLKTIAESVHGALTYETVAPINGNAARILATRGEQRVNGFVTWATDSVGTGLTVYVMSAPIAQYPAVQDIFSKVATSFRAQGPAVTGEPMVEFVQFRDPKEASFTLDVPKDWTINGGLYRFASVDTRPMVTATSPDTKIYVQVGDKDVPWHIVPNTVLNTNCQLTGSVGCEGTTTSQLGMTALIKSYVTAKAYAQQYATQTLAKSCQNIQFGEAVERTDFAKKLNDILARQTQDSFFTFKVEASEVAFTCTRNSQSQAGYLMVGMRRNTMSQPSLGLEMEMWRPEYIFAYLADTAVAHTANDVLARMATSFRPDPEWERAQGQIAANTAQIAADLGKAISDLVASSYWTKQAVDSELSRRRSNATLDVTDVIDPATGTSYRVESGAHYYWLDPKGNIVGTNTYTQPTIDFRPLVSLP